MGRNVFLSCEIRNEISSWFAANGYLVSLLPADKGLPSPIASHPDILIFNSPNGLLMTENYYQSNKQIFDARGIIPKRTSEKHGDKYPQDILLNALYANGKVYCKRSAVSGVIRESFDTVNVNQGYARCSSCVINLPDTSQAVITADAGIAGALENNGVKALRISEGHIALPPYNFGFIGGASADTENSVLFFGNLAAHPDFEKIRDFVSGCGKETVFFDSFELTDYGSCVIF